MMTERWLSAGKRRRFADFFEILGLIFTRAIGISAALELLDLVFAFIRTLIYDWFAYRRALG